LSGVLARIGYADGTHRAERHAPLLRADFVLKDESL
jgi:hypothetical protein